MNNLFTIARKDGSGAIIWTEAQKRYIITEYQDKDNTLKNLAQLFKVRPESIRNLLRKEGIPITNKKTRNYPRNSCYFDIIDTPDKAYWLGMFFSDGMIDRNTNKLALYLKDKEHVEKLRSALKANNTKITKVTDTRFSKPCFSYGFTI